VPVLAHPERNERTRSAGAVVQVTIDSVMGSFGRRARRSAIELLELGLVDVLASDAHVPQSYAYTRVRLEEAVGDRAAAHRLTVQTPAAIAAGESPLPSVSRSRRA
jgi:tyrosine-protein phosphatase YwqE